MVPVGAQQKFQLTGTNITGSFTASSAFNFGRADRIRFFVAVILNTGSGITSINVKLQQRYNDGTNVTAYTDLPSNLDDVQGTAQPKSNTWEITHAITGLSAPVVAPGTALTFYLDKPWSMRDVTINVQANTTGISGDSVTVYVTGL